MRILNKGRWPHQVTVRPDRTGVNIDTWCSETIGKKFIDWFSFSAGNGIEIYAFCNKENLIVFSLAWNCKKL